MSSAIITVENLGKKYQIRHQGEGRGSTSLREALTMTAASLVRGLTGSNGRRPGGESDSGSTREEFWALRDVSFDVKEGEVLGIIGRNGAGKSTLLKILSRITEPTHGRIHIRGRVASLLEVGTGFHPELTGRENVFLNGAILGMSRVEIKRKFDEIVDFSGVERFLDTPVKRYSSGMYVRLAFAVAAHLEPEVLIVDEVLSVGDVEFQKKCLGKIESVSRSEGRTVLFVSHQIAAVTRLCQKALWLHAGDIKVLGRAHLVCSEYLANGASASSRRVWTDVGKAPGNEWVRLESVEALAGGEPANQFLITSPLDIKMTYQVLKNGKVLIPNIHLYSDDGTLIFISHDWYSGWRTKPKPPGRYQTTFTVPGNFFSEGRFTVKVAMGTYQPFEAHFQEPDVVAFTVVDSSGDGTSRGDYAGPLPGIIRPLIGSRTEILNQQHQTDN